MYLVLRQQARARRIGLDLRGFGQRFLERLAAQQRGALGQAIGDQQFMVARVGVVGLFAQDEVDGRARGVLVQPLEEGCLLYTSRCV